MRACLLFVLMCVAPLTSAGTTVTTLPAQPLVETGRTAQHLNFDLLFDNDGDRALELTGLEVTLFDRDGRFFAQRRVDRNGDPTTMSLATLPNRTLPAHGRLVVVARLARRRFYDIVNEGSSVRACAVG